MRTPDSTIKAAILHPEQAIREAALHYFSDAYCDDDSIMPLVIQAVEKYGRETGFILLWDAERLPQTEATVNWIVNELRRDYDLNDLMQENYCFALALILYRAPSPSCGSGLTTFSLPQALPNSCASPFRIAWNGSPGIGSVAGRR